VGSSAPALDARFPELPFLWLEFERGGEGVFLMNREQLVTFQPLFREALEQT
jgi:ribosomal protein L3 glutamine methyltransferase